MKDLPHHMKKLNRRVIRSMHREEHEEEAYAPTAAAVKPSKQEVRKQAKQKIKKKG